MEKEKFHALIPVISTDIIRMIATKYGIPDKEAIKLLYESTLYTALEKEETKLWQYSTPMLYSLLEQEWRDGTIAYPDV